ncbi:hypothetical protein STANM309S_01321 [Streptomyces tanashiensis]
MSIAPARAAFFDVDETLITCKSMACVLARYWGRGEVAAAGSPRPAPRSSARSARACPASR